MRSDYLVVPLDLHDLTWTEAIVLSELAFLRRLFPKITASNEYLSSKLRLNPRTISRAINQLINLNYIISNLHTKNNITKRSILLTEKSLKVYGLDVAFKNEKKPLSAPLNAFLND